MLRPLALAILLALAPAAAAGTAEEPELSDAAGDASLAVGLDVVAAWVESVRGRVDEDRFTVDVHLQVDGPLDPTQAGSVDVTWVAGPFLDPADESSRRGVRFTWSAGAGTWAPLLLEEGAWTAGISSPTAGDPATGLLIARDAPSGGGAYPHLRDFAATSTVAVAGAAVDDAVGTGTWERPGPFALVDALDLPSRGHDLRDKAEDDLPGSIDALGAWVDEDDSGITVTAEVRELTGQGILDCQWWRIALFALDSSGAGSTVLSSYNSMHIEDAVVTFSSHGGERRWDARGQSLGEDNPTRVEYDAQVDLLLGSPGAVRLHLDGASWNGTNSLRDSYHSVSLSCDALGGQSSDDLRHNSSLFGGDGMLVPAPSFALALVALALVGALRRL